MKRIWKDIPGYNGRYMASNLGEIKSYPVKFVNKQTKGFSLRKGRKLKQWDSRGYQRVGLVVDNKHKFFSVHRLIAITFLPLIPGKNVVNHKDGNPRNNNVENLEWCTQKENMNHSLNILKRQPNRSQKVQHIETGIIYPSIKEAHEKLKISFALITTRLMLRGELQNKTGLKKII